ncbi:hypothetical protein UPYG_G00079770 [Umbra pygmaea]|uniref:Uncharacterized protein n=1 Tax=Umbra pygmaea TaxID=75934 RepID=A0ABD0XDG7_UMBPY
MVQLTSSSNTVIQLRRKIASINFQAVVQISICKTRPNKCPSSLHRDRCSSCIPSHSRRSESAGHLCSSSKGPEEERKESVPSKTTPAKPVNLGPHGLSSPLFLTTNVKVKVVYHMHRITYIILCRVP